MSSIIKMKCPAATLIETYPWDDPRFETANKLFVDNNFTAALALYEDILHCLPDHPRALHASGFLLHRMGRSGEAIVRIHKALQFKPDFAQAYNSLGTVYMQTGQIPEALLYYVKASELVPEFFSNYLLCLEYDANASAEVRFQRALECAAHNFNRIPQRTTFPNLIDPEKPLRIGLVSPDFGVHPVGLFLLPLLEFNDRERYRFICYSSKERHDDVNGVLRENCLAWREVASLSDEEIRYQIDQDRIDILVDLSGHTGQNRLKLFTSRAAPIQITWLGYSSTTAVPAMDYIFTDKTAVLPGEECYFTENVYRFTPSRFCYLPVGSVPEVSSLPLLQKGYCTFGSFNNLAKLTPEVVALWSKVMGACANSRIILKNTFLSDPWVCDRYLGLFRHNGISSDRIEFRLFSSHEAMLGEYADIDIALDPFPYCGGMTSCNAIWMGVPVITLAGDRPIGRQTQGFLELAGLSELIATDLEDYISIAAGLASNPERLAAMRSSLRDRLSSSPLTDPFAFTRMFEEGLRAVWQNWCKDQLPAKNESWDDPRFDEAYRLFQTALQNAMQPDDAYKLYISLLSDYPDHPRALHALGVVLHKMGESDDGVAYIRRALHLKPDYADAFNNLGNVYNEIRQFAEAEECFRRLAVLRPESHVAHKNLARALLEIGRREEALAECKKSLAILPNYADGLLTYGNILMATGEASKALDVTRSANRLVPRDANIHTNLLYTMNFLPEVTQEELYRESLRWGKRHANGKLSLRPHLNSPTPDRKLRIGYVSGDFKLHPVSYHLKPVIEHHDRHGYEIYLYSTFNKHDEMTELLRKHAEHFRVVASLSDEQLEEMIRVDGIDILVDLSGHTAFNKLGLFALKPAPLQVSWLGYFNTTGLKAIDYLLSDAITIPAGDERWIAEKVLRLPDGRFCYDPPEYMPEVTGGPAQNNGFITFGSFNKLAKMTRETVALWSAVLNSVPESRLVLKTDALSEKSVADKAVSLFVMHGIEPERVELRGDSPHPQMLAQYGDIDIALDTFPFNGGATTCEALWMGVPVITLSGHTPISRQSASLLSSCGLSALIAYTHDEFVSIVTALASDFGSLAELRASMREKLAGSPLSDGKLFAANLERAYRDIWHCWCNTQKDAIRMPYTGKTSFDEYYNAAIDRMDDNDDHSAVTLFRYALRKKPDSARALNNLGISLSNLGVAFRKQAAACLRKAILLEPTFGEAYKNLGRVLDEMKQTRFCQEAEEAFLTAAKLLPDDASVLYMLANFRLSLGYPQEALEIYQRAKLLAPEDSNIHANTIFAMNYVPNCSQEDILAESRLWELNYGWKGEKHDFRKLPGGQARLRIGYVSADLHKHPVGIFFQAVAVHHDREHIQIYCYNNCQKPRTDEVKGVISHNVDVWRDVNNLSDEDLFTLILADRIDILVDLSGYTDGNRLKVFSRRAAPVQVSWLGYYNTTGIASMDYVITDEMTVPIGFEQWYSETVVRMPFSRFCFTPAYICPDVEPLAALQSGRITFGSFNNFAKLTEEVIEVWSQILSRVPKSRIVLKWKNFSEKNIKAQYRFLFAMHGISSRRIEFRDASAPFMMQDEYNDIDIALDPFPFTGGLTSCEALWMGVPVVTFAGDRPVSRQTAGFLRAIGLDELIAGNSADYVEKAVALAGDIQALAQLKAGIRQKFADSPLCDGPGFTAALEEIYRSIWAEWLKNSGAAENGTGMES